MLTRRHKNVVVMVTLVSLVAAPLMAGHHSESVAHRCVGCATGQCQVSKPFGFFRKTWRPFPGNAELLGVRKPTPRVAVPKVNIPDAINEINIEPRTRSEDNPNGLSTPILSNFGGATTTGGPEDAGGDTLSAEPSGELPSPDATDTRTEDRGFDPPAGAVNDGGFRNPPAPAGNEDTLPGFDDNPPTNNDDGGFGDPANDSFTDPLDQFNYKPTRARSQFVKRSAERKLRGRPASTSDASLEDAKSIAVLSTQFVPIVPETLPRVRVGNTGQGTSKKSTPLAQRLPAPPNLLAASETTKPNRLKPTAKSEENSLVKSQQVSLVSHQEAAPKESGAAAKLESGQRNPLRGRSRPNLRRVSHSSKPSQTPITSGERDVKPKVESVSAEPRFEKPGKLKVVQISSKDSAKVDLTKKRALRTTIRNNPLRARR